VIDRGRMKYLNNVSNSLRVKSSLKTMITKWRCRMTDNGTHLQESQQTI
jgi:hypothetical protein